MAKNKRQIRANGATLATKADSQAVSSPVAGQTPGFNPDYSYVLADLRRIGILAGSFIVVLVVVSFFLR
jgi:hypothetical protein